MPVRVPSASEIGLGRAVASPARDVRLDARAIGERFGGIRAQSTARTAQALSGR